MVDVVGTKERRRQREDQQQASEDLAEPAAEMERPVDVERQRWGTTRWSMGCRWPDQRRFVCRMVGWAVTAMYLEVAADCSWWLAYGSG